MFCFCSVAKQLWSGRLAPCGVGMMGIPAQRVEPVPAGLHLTRRPRVSLDLLVRGLLVAGATPKDIGRTIAAAGAHRARR